MDAASTSASIPSGGVVQIVRHSTMHDSDSPAGGAGAGGAESGTSGAVFSFFGLRPLL
jgi:hypothetical protein